MSNDRIEHGASGTSFIGPSAVNIMRMVTLERGLRMEMRGMRLTMKARTCYAIIKSEYGLRGNRAKVLAQFLPLLEEARAQVPVVKRD